MQTPIINKLRKLLKHAVEPRNYQENITNSSRNGKYVKKITITLLDKDTSR